MGLHERSDCSRSTSFVAELASSLDCIINGAAAFRAPSTYVTVSGCDLTLKDTRASRHWHMQASKILQNTYSIFHPRRRTAAWFGAPLLCSVLGVAEAPPPPVGLWNQEALPDHWLHHQLHQAGRIWHKQLRHSIQIRIGTTHQDQLTRRDSGIRSSQPSPVHSEMADELRWVCPVQGGVEAQARGQGRGLRWGASTMQPHHVIDAQALNQLWGNL